MNYEEQDWKSNRKKRKYDLEDTTLKFISGPDGLDSQCSEEGAQRLRVEMSCGHSVTPESLTGFCRSLLDQGQYKFKCPALKQGTLQRCEAVWSYQEVRRLAVLTTEEMQYFEENMARLAAAEYCEFKACPGCKTYVTREDATNLSVWCKICTADKKNSFQFCWQCLREWKGPAPRSDCCDNDGCIDHDLELLKNCKDTALHLVQGVDACPSIRACPTCGTLLEHDKTGCKNITCPRCQVEFCFVCLKLTAECLQTSSYFIPCRDGVAPRQTSIPVWRRRQEAKCS